MDTERELRILLDERAITAVMHRYCQALDSARVADWLDCFTRDALFEVLLPNGETYVRLEGEADFARFAAAMRDRPGHKHVYASPVVEVDVDAGEARGTSYFLMFAGDAGQAMVSSFGRVRDRFVKRDGRWKIAERRLQTDGMNPAAP